MIINDKVNKKSIEFNKKIYYLKILMKILLTLKVKDI